MAKRLAISAGTDIACIGILDCSRKRLTDIWIGRGVAGSELTLKQAVGAVSRAIAMSLSLTPESDAAAIRGAGRGPGPGDAGAAIWLKSDRYLIGIGERIGNVAAITAFVVDAARAPITDDLKNVAQIGLTYADQLLHERFNPRDVARARIPEIILRSLSFGFAVADAQGSLGYVTESSEKWLADSDDLHVAGGRLMAASPHNQQLLQTALAEATTGAGKSSVVQLDGAEGPLKTIVVMPISEIPPLAMIVFGQEEGDSDLRELMLETMGLTVAERRLALQLLSGKSLTAAAAESNLTISTARSYLKRIFAKTGINRQSQFITLFHTLMPPVRSGGRPRSSDPRH